MRYKRESCCNYTATNGLGFSFLKSTKYNTKKQVVFSLHC